MPHVTWTCHLRHSYHLNFEIETEAKKNSVLYYSSGVGKFHILTHVYHCPAHLSKEKHVHPKICCLYAFKVQQTSSSSAVLLMCANGSNLLCVHEKLGIAIARKKELSLLSSSSYGGIGILCTFGWHRTRMLPRMFRRLRTCHDNLFKYCQERPPSFGRHDSPCGWASGRSFVPTTRPPKHTVDTVTAQWDSALIFVSVLSYLVIFCGALLKQKGHTKAIFWDYSVCRLPPRATFVFQKHSCRLFGA